MYATIHTRSLENMPEASTVSVYITNSTPLHFAANGNPMTTCPGGLHTERPALLGCNSYSANAVTIKILASAVVTAAASWTGWGKHPRS